MTVDSTRLHPKILCLSGHDPSGGAGLQADIESITALGGVAQGVITALTVQDSQNVRRSVSVDAGLLREQIGCLLDDGLPQAIKIGLIGDASQLPVINSAIQRARVPVVCDPVLRAGGGHTLHQQEFINEFLRALLPRLDLLTPNAAEARRLMPAAQTPDDCGRGLIEAGCANVLITGGDEPGGAVFNRWYSKHAPPRIFEWPRLTGPFHGAGCTLAAALACQLAHGMTMQDAIRSAQAWTQQALSQAIAIGRGRLIPLRRASPPRDAVG